ncbi:Protein SHORT HYPOCOTYL IN WHITE LIGHT 1, partial [Cucurbita argyrosperma subsp. argyrosperma]
FVQQKTKASANGCCSSTADHVLTCRSFTAVPLFHSSFSAAITNLSDLDSLPFLANFSHPPPGFQKNLQFLSGPPDFSSPLFAFVVFVLNLLDLFQGVDHLVDDRRNWNRSISSDFDIIGGEDDEDDEDEENEEEDRSLDLLVRFVENVFRKVSKRARKAVRSVLPQSIPTKLVGFSVNGVLMLAFLWILKAFLEVICTLGTAVFVSILIIRGVWTGILYLQDIRSHRFNRLDDDQHHAWTGAQPAS